MHATYLIHSYTYLHTLLHVFTHYIFPLAILCKSGSNKKSNKYHISRKFTGVLSCLGFMYNSRGIKGLYAGYTASVTGVFIFRALYLGGYDILKEVYKLDKPTTTYFEKYIAAQSVTTVVGTLCYPIDTVKCRMMMQGERAVAVYRSGFHCFVSIIKNEGTTALFHGLSVNLFRGIFGALLLVFYDGIKPVVSDYVVNKSSGNIHT